MKIECEHTDTFGGEANYSWVRRETIEVPDDITDLALVRRAKAALRLTGVRGRTTDLGETIVFRPYGENTIAFFTVVCC